MAYQCEDSTSSEMRHDWLADRWVIIAPQRTQRPNDYVFRPPLAVDSQNCPFCVGHESCTPEAVASYVTPKHAARTGYWDVRVVPNKFPAVNTSQEYHEWLSNQHTRHNGTACEEYQPYRGGLAGRINGCSHDLGNPQDLTIDLFRRRDLIGGHEVIVESPQHVQSISQLDRETTLLVFTAYRDRLLHWLDTCGLAYGVVFKNVGLDAGASLAHTHSQLIATDIMPTDVARSVERMKLFTTKESACLFCRMADDELEQEVRIVEQTPDFIAFCPFASRLPSLVTIIPKSHQSAFQAIDQSQLEQLSWLTHRLVRRIEHCYPDAAYNFIIHTAPHSLRSSDSFHWRLELFPRITKVAGFEWGSDCYINPIAPEHAAQALRCAGV